MTAAETGTPQAAAETAEATVLPARPLRRDAERNRLRILRAAAEVFTEQGLRATLDDVADRAGVGVGTVYRRFPDKEALVEACSPSALTRWSGSQSRLSPIQTHGPA